MKCRRQGNQNPWLVIFQITAFGIGCLLFGNYIKSQSTDPITAGLGNALMSIGTTTMLVLTLSALVVLGIAYLIYRWR